MKAKLVIVNNGLKDLRGHYFETSVAIAEAARKLGYQPILATHVSCPRAIIPDWLDFYPLFTTDHWMAGPPVPPPNLHGLRGDAVAPLRVTIDSVRDGKHTLADYLRARFETLQFPEMTAPLPQPEAAVALPLSQTAWLKQWARQWVPPAVFPALRWVYQRRTWPISAARDILRGSVPPAMYDKLRQIKRRLQGVAPVPSTTVPSSSLPALVEPPSDPLQRDLEHAQQGTEVTHLLAFHRDLQRLLCLTGTSANDHVFLPTAHGRELLAIQRFVADLRPVEPPTFHLEFRHALDMPASPTQPDVLHPYAIAHRIYFAHCRRQPCHPRIKLYTDTEELTEEYEQVSGLSFRVLPIPFRSRLLQPHRHYGVRPLCLAFLGDVRDEKGFHWLPDLIDALMAEYVVTERVRFLIQSTLVQPDWNPRSQTALIRLRQYSPQHVSLTGVEAPLTPEEYYKLVAEADVLLCPYSPQAYRRRSSGTLTEALAAGIPTIVPGGTWLERQLPSGAGETFQDLASFIDAVRRVVDQYARFQMCARLYKDRHSPRALVEQLVDAGDGGNSALRLAV